MNGWPLHSTIGSAASLRPRVVRIVSVPVFILVLVFGLLLGLVVGDLDLDLDLLAVLVGLGARLL